MTTILSELGEFDVSTGQLGGLWLTPDKATATTGWVLKPEGLCRSDICVPVPATQAETFVADGNVNLAAFWDRMNMPSARSDDGEVWVLGEGAENRAATLRSLEARTLPFRICKGSHTACRTIAAKRFCWRPGPRGAVAGKTLVCGRNSTKN